MNGTSQVVMIDPVTDHQLILLDERLSSSIKFALDQLDRKLYFATNGSIFSADLAMTKESQAELLAHRTIQELGIESINELCVDSNERRLYWIENGNRIRSSNMHGRDLVLHVDSPDAELTSISSYQSFIFATDRKINHNQETFTEYYIRYFTKKLSFNPNDELISSTVSDIGEKQVKSKYKLQSVPLQTLVLEPLALPENTCENACATICISEARKCHELN